MAFDPVNIGTTANDGTGDTLRAAFEKINANFGIYNVEVNAQTGTTYELVLDDQRKLVTLANANPVEVTLPTNTAAPFPLGTVLALGQLGAGAVTIVAPGVTVNGVLHGTATSTGQYAPFTLTKVGTDSWWLAGDVGEVTAGDPPPSSIVATGGTITEADGYTIHTFTTDGTFEVTSGAGEVEYLIVGGGGGGGQSNMVGGGGGAGFVRAGEFTVATDSYPVVIGAGGAGATVQATDGATGGASSVFSLTSGGGGGGGGLGAEGPGLPGANGGGGRGHQSAVFHAGGAGDPGNDGGAGWGDATVDNRAGGGGGSTAQVGANAAAGVGGNGGLGTQSSITGTALFYGGGGGGGVRGAGGTFGAGGSGVGGDGSLDSGGSGGNAAANTGSGGGGGHDPGVGGNGSDGVVIIRYQ